MIAVAVWGKQWIAQTVQVHCDNAAVVAILNSGDSKDNEAMHLCRCLAFITARFQINLFATHVRGIDNSLADALSRDNATYFHSHHPQAKQLSTPIPAELLDLLVVEKPDWRSAAWTALWISTFGMD